MKKNIHYLSLKLIKNLALSVIILGCTQLSADKLKNINAKFITPTKDEINLELALTTEQQTKGLSGRKEADFSFSQGMLFAYDSSDYRSFWMPDTYFNLDIIFLDKSFIILEIARDVPFHEGYSEPPAIFRLEPVMAQHVLEMSSKSPIAKKLKIGDQLTWSSSFSLEEILKETRQQQ